MLLIAGDSHTAALHAGLLQLDPATRQTLEGYFGPIKLRAIMTGAQSYGPFFDVSAEGISMRGPVVETFDALTDGAGTIVPHDRRAFGFSFGLHLFGFDIKSPGFSGRWTRYGLVKSDDRQFLSNAVMTEIILHHGRYILRFARTLKQMDVAAFFIGPPPVRRKHIETYMTSMTEHEVIKLQGLFWTVMEDALRKAGIPVVLAPPETIAEGMMRPGFELDRPDDFHHANARYGSLVWQQIAARAAAGDLCVQRPDAV